MKNLGRNLLKVTLISVAMLVIIAATNRPARADEVTVSGSTVGATSVPNLLFTGNGSFTATTALGFGSLSGPNSLGTLFLNTAPTATTGGIFQLGITFLTPTGIAGGQDTSYQAIVIGTVSPNIDQGGVNVHFENPTQTFTFSNGTTTGSFSLTVADLFVQSGRAANITAGIRGEQAPAVPEPTTLLLLGSGITGLAAKLRSRRKKK